MAQVIPSSAVPVARQWTAAAAWSARVREVRADPLRRHLIGPRTAVFAAQLMGVTRAGISRSSPRP